MSLSKQSSQAWKWATGGKACGEEELRTSDHLPQLQQSTGAHPSIEYGTAAKVSSLPIISAPVTEYKRGNVVSDGERYPQIPVTASLRRNPHGVSHAALQAPPPSGARLITWRARRPAPRSPYSRQQPRSPSGRLPAPREYRVGKEG